MNFLIDEVVAHTFGVTELPDYFQESYVIQLRNNVIPKGLLSFEQFFNSEYVQRSKTLVFQKETHFELEVEPQKSIKVGSKCIKEEKEMLLHIYHDFSKVIAWTYDDLKTYDKNMIQHTIELMPNAKPYRKK